MNIIQAFILSVIEGVTEFLPISSTGHLVLASNILGISETDFVKTFEIVIQLGAIMAVVVLYFKKFISSWELIKKLITAFIPTAAVGLVLYPFIKHILLGNAFITLNALMWGGIALILVEYYLVKNKKNRKKKEDLSYNQALVIGVFQSISIIPGVSRSAATIVGGLLTGLDRPQATEFSFLLAVPTMIAATALDVYKSRGVIAQGGLSIIIFGTILSFIFALIAVKFLINFVKKHTFIGFGVYRIILSILYFIFVL